MGSLALTSKCPEFDKHSFRLLFDVDAIKIKSQSWLEVDLLSISLSLYGSNSQTIHHNSL